MVPWVEYESLVEGVLDGALRGVGDEEVVMGDGVENFSSSLVRSTTRSLGGMMVSLIFLEMWIDEDGFDSMIGEEM